MDDESWTKVVKVVAPGIRKMKVSNAALLGITQDHIIIIIITFW